MQTPGTLTTARLILTFWVGLSVAHAAPDDAERRATLEAIHALENPRDLTRPGPRGELGAYQFRETTWRAYTDVPFVRALDRPMSDFVATQHYAWLRRRLEQAHVTPTIYNIALAWNGGVSAAITGRASRAARNYAQRAANLAAAYARERAVATSP